MNTKDGSVKCQRGDFAFAFAVKIALALIRHQCSEVCQQDLEAACEVIGGHVLTEEDEHCIQYDQKQEIELTMRQCSSNPDCTHSRQDDERQPDHGVA